MSVAGEKAAASETAAGACPAEVSPEVLAQLGRLRRSIDNIDAALVHMLAERFRCTQEVGELKAANHLPASDPDREIVQIARLKQLALDSNLDPVFAEKWFNFVVAEVIRNHLAIADDPA
ncbi:MAG: chorismate mutase [Microbacteriaceae bacterium]|nr:chorismate mutase [Microbacteriaceae bacterium]